MHRPLRAFTLIEVLIVLGIIAVLAAIVLVAINPARQFAQARNTQRQSNVTTILDGIDQRTIDGQGTFAGAFASSAGTQASCPALPQSNAVEIMSGSLGIDLSCLVPTYIPGALPFDPGAANAHWTSATDYDTGYKAMTDSGGRVTVLAPGAEQGATVSVTR